MSILTKAYAIPASLRDRTVADAQFLTDVLDPVNEDDVAFASYNFDTRIEALVTVFREAGCVEASKAIDGEHYRFVLDSGHWMFRGYDLWLVETGDVQSASRELNRIVFSDLTSVASSYGLKDRRGNVIPFDRYGEFFGDLEAIKQFFDSAVTADSFLIFSEG